MSISSSPVLRIGSRLQSVRAGHAVLVIVAALAASSCLAEEEPAALNGQFLKEYRAGELEAALETGTKALAEADQRADVAAQLVWLNNLSYLRFMQDRAELEIPLRKRILELLEAQRGSTHPQVAVALISLGLKYVAIDRPELAEPLFERATKIAASAGQEESLDRADVLNSLGLLHSNRGDLAAAEKLYRQSVAMRKKLTPPQDALVAERSYLLAALLGRSGKSAEAEHLLRELLKISRKESDYDQLLVSNIEMELGFVLAQQARHGEADPILESALGKKQQFLGNHPRVAVVMSRLGNLRMSQNRLNEAGELFEKALAVREKSEGKEHRNVAGALIDLAWFRRRIGSYDEAELLLERALEIQRRDRGAHYPGSGRVLLNLAGLQFSRARLAQAEQKATEALAILQRTGAETRTQIECYGLRAEARWRQGDKQNAIADLQAAVERIETLQLNASGAEQGRATTFAAYSGLYERLLEWQRQLGDIAGAFDEAERSRARGLVDQMQAARIDPLAGLPNEETVALRDAETDAERALAAADARWRLAAAEKSSDLAIAEQALRQARKHRVEVYVAARNASRAFRQTSGSQRFEPVSLDDARRRLTADGQLVLEYVVGRADSYVIAIGPGDRPARIHVLEVGIPQARTLAIYAGALGRSTLQRALVGEAVAKPAAPEGTKAPAVNENAPALAANAPRARGLDVRKPAGTPAARAEVMTLLRRPQASPELVAALAALWDTLLPAAERELIASGQVRRLTVIPDGPLYLLPFESLVVEGGKQPRYLLDLDIPVAYAPSATVLDNLCGGQSPAPSPPIRSVLSVGDPLHGRVGLSALPSAAWESAWVAENFGKAGVQAKALQKRNATEAAVRLRLTGSQVLHFACHGLVDDQSANLLGALALTPGTVADDPGDDGQLTLAEVYGLDLKGCELAILSACETNYGPQQQGEGVWALSRGFLVAGARRVVASNWLVDDEAAATLISYFCGELARQQDGAAPDYARALHNAKRLVRKNPKWQSPFYWAMFELLGPP